MSPVACVREPAGFRDRGARRAAADRKALKQAGGDVGCAEGNHLLVLTDLVAAALREGARQHTGIGEGQQRNDDRAGQQAKDLVQAGGGHPKFRQPLGHRAQDRNVGHVPQIQQARRHRGQRHRDQDAGPFGAIGLEQQDEREGAGTDQQGHSVGAAVGDALDQFEGLLRQIVGLDRKTEELGQTARSAR
jgi:hypothetical protein